MTIEYKVHFVMYDEKNKHLQQARVWVSISYQSYSNGLLSRSFYRWYITCYVIEPILSSLKDNRYEVPGFIFSYTPYFMIYHTDIHCVGHHVL